MLMLVRRKPVVIHWVGTDVMIAREAYERGKLSLRLADGAAHWCDAPWLVDELAEMGIAAEYVALPVPLPHREPSELPGRFRVLLYLPVDPFDREVFDMETILRLPAELPEVEFLLLPSTAETLPDAMPANLEARGWVTDMEALYREVTVYVRLTSHDGMSFMALESLARGRYVIWTHPLEGAVQAEGLEAVAGVIRELYEHHQRGELALNTAGRDATLAALDEETALDEIDRRFRDLL
jgi:hypothetical protein